MSLPRVATVQDISCFGKCSLTVALPIISAAGVETVVLPTAVLSTHTGGLGKFTYRDLTEDMPAVIEHWRTLDLHFDAIYSAYLGSISQIDIVSDFINKFKCPDTLVLIDPVMGDGGKLYTRFTPEFVAKMGALCAQADIIVPNLTEAAFLLDIPYRDRFENEGQVLELLEKLRSLGAKKVVLTGVSFGDGRLGAAWHDGTGTGLYMCERINSSFHGSGDAFASVLTAGTVRGKSLEQAVALAVDFTVDVIARTVQAKTDPKHGLHFEGSLPMLWQRLEK